MKKKDMKKIGIYLAGKIKTHCWRHSIYDMRNMFSGCDYPACKESVESLKNKSVYVKMYDTNVCITGPFFLSCDHSCYHGEGSHGLGKDAAYECYGWERTYSETEVIEICDAQIKRADIVFAYINDDTCYGTLFELGLAKQMGKQVVTIFDNEERKNKMWFIAANSDYSATLLDDIEKVYSYFETIEEADAIAYMMNAIKNYKEYPR